MTRSGEQNNEWDGISCVFVRTNTKALNPGPLSRRQEGCVCGTWPARYHSKYARDIGSFQWRTGPEPRNGRNFVTEYLIVKWMQICILINIAFVICAFNLLVKCFKVWKFAMNSLRMALFWYLLALPWRILDIGSCEENKVLCDFKCYVFKAYLIWLYKK
jgi:hypothetical protein